MSEQFREAIITTPPLYLISEDGMRGEKIVDANVTEWPDIHVGVAAIDDTPKPKTRAAKRRARRQRRRRIRTSRNQGSELYNSQK